jgi:sugar phosphate isomerase/epimerase
VEIGIYTHTFDRPTLGETLDAVVGHGLHAVQLNLSNAGLPTLPDEIAPADVARIRGELDARRVRVAALAGTYNMIDPDLAKRRDGMRRLGVLAAAGPGLGAEAMTLCTGTRDSDNMWRRHPDNDTPEAWRDMVAAMAEAAAIAEANRVTLAFEPEVSNVVDSARKARRLLDEVRSPRLKVCIDGANLFHAGELPRMGEILDEAFDLLGHDVVLAHAKDLDRDGAAGHLAAGHGLLDYDRYLGLLQRIRYTGAVVLHGLTESQIDGCVDFLRGKLGRVGAPGTVAS